MVDNGKYSPDNGSNWNTVTFPNETYSYSDLNDYFHQVMENNGHKKSDCTFDINILYILSTYKVVIEVSNIYQLDLRNTEFGDLIGFDKNFFLSTEYGTRLLNIANSIDTLYINSDIMSDSLVGDVLTDTLLVVPTANLKRSRPFTIEPKRALFNPVSTFMIGSIRFSILDSLKRPVNLKGIDWYMNLVLRSTPI